MDRYRRHQTRIVLPLFLCLLATAASCGRTGHTFTEVTEAGIPVARTTGGPLLTEPPFRLEREMVFGDPGQGEAARLTSPRGYVEVPGGLAVLDNGSKTVKVFNDDGSLRFSLGREGEGPGEFRDPRMDHGLTPDGRILITDGVNLRLTRIDPVTADYEMISTGETRSWNAAQVSADMFVIIHPTFTPSFEQLESLDLVDREFAVADTIAAVPAGRVQRVSRGPDDETGIPVSRPFWPPFSWWTQAGRIAVCSGIDYHVDVYDLTGKQIRSIEWDAPRSAVTDSMWQAASVQIERSFGAWAPTVWNALERPETLPSVEGIRIDDLGRLWALRYIPSERWGGPENQTLDWDVFAPGGEWLGTQSFPGITRYFGNNTCYMTEAREESSVVIRYRLVLVGR